MSKEALQEEIIGESFEHIEKLKAENLRLKAQQKKREKWIEKDEKLANKPRTGRLVTKNDIDDPTFMKKYPDAQIGDEFNDPEPLLWKIGLKKRPTLEDTHAQIAAQFARDLREDIEQAHDEEFLDDFDEQETFTESELQGFLHQASIQEKQAEAIAQTQQEALPPAEQSDEGATGGEATAEPPVPSSGSSQSEE